MTLRNCLLTQLVLLSYSWGLNFNLRLFALKTERVVQYHHATPVLVPCIGVMTMGHGSRKMTHFHLWARVIDDAERNHCLTSVSAGQ